VQIRTRASWWGGGGQDIGYTFLTTQLADKDGSQLNNYPRVGDTDELCWQRRRRWGGGNVGGDEEEEGEKRRGSVLSMARPEREANRRRSGGRTCPTEASRRPA
jgi:hypothetical protein